jgi:hypothetical protein
VVPIRISLIRGLLLTRKLLNQGFLLVKLKSSLRKFYVRHYDWADRDGIYVSQMTTDNSTCRKHLPVLSSFMTYYRILTTLTRVSLVEQKLFTLPEHLSSPPVFSGVRVSRSLVLYVCFIDRCLSFCTFFFWP